MDAESIVANSLRGLLGSERRAALRRLTRGMTRGECAVVAGWVYRAVRGECVARLSRRVRRYSPERIRDEQAHALDRWRTLGLEVCVACAGPRRPKVSEIGARAYTCEDPRCAKSWRELNGLAVAPPLPSQPQAARPRTARKVARPALRRVA